MPYCSSESKIQGYEDEMEIEIDSSEVTDVQQSEGNKFTIQVSVEATLNRLCAGCGSTSSTLAMTIEGEVEHECVKFVEGGDEPEFEVNDFEEQGQTDRFEKGQRGKRYLGVEVGGTLTCSLCDEVIAVEGLNGEDQASAWEVEQH